MSEEPKPKRTITTRRHHSEELWAQARRDYLAGYTPSAVSALYGMSVDAIRTRAARHSGTRGAWARKPGDDRARC